MRAPDDRGAVAVIVVLVVTLVLIPVAALAVDLGSVYVRESSLQATADGAARAGAEELALRQRDTPNAPQVMSEARTKVVQTLCAGVTHADDPWAAPCTAGSTWASDGDASNGEVSFYLGKPSADHSFDPVTQDANGATTGDLVTGIRVVTPPSRVTFGLAGTFTNDHADPQVAAAAGIFTVLPRNGFFPMFLRPGEHGVFCTRSAPRSIWETVSLSGACNPAVARGNLVASRTDSTENQKAMDWNTAKGFDADHLPLPGGVATFQIQNVEPEADRSRVRSLTPGLFGVDPALARLRTGVCPGGYSASSGLWSGIESAYLTNFLDTSRGDKYAFRSVVKGQSALDSAQHGWLSPSVLRCGRLAAVPLLSDVQDPLPTDGLGSDLEYPVAGLGLIWLDDRLWSGEGESTRVSSGPCLSRGFYWGAPTECQSILRAYTGYVLDPRLLPATISDTDAINVLDQFVGSGLPVTIRLLRDVGDPLPS